MPVPAGHREFIEIDEAARRAHFGDDAAPALTPAEWALLDAAKKLGPLPPRGAIAAQEAAAAREWLIQTQNDTVARWLQRIGAFKVLTDGTQVVQLDKLPLEITKQLGRPGDTQNVKSNHPKSKGGNPGRDDWPPFVHEISRRLILDGGNLTRTELRKYMKSWAASNMRTPPDDRTIERKIDEQVPSDVWPD